MTFSGCLSQQLQAGADWATIGTQCAGLGGGTAALVSTSNIPVAAGSAASFGGFLGRKGSIAVTDTINYYLATAAPGSLAAFKSTYGFPAGEVTATYYNDGDLGLGREMHCKLVGAGVACYVTNYSGIAGQAAFDQPVSTVLADAVARQHAFATVAMSYTGIPGPNAVKFVVYDASGNWAHVCGSSHIMPQAEHVMKRFWQSGARAYLVTGYGPASYPDPLQACQP